MLFSILTNDMFFSVMVIQTCKTIQMTTFNIPVQEFLMRLWELKKDFLVLLNMRFYNNFSVLNHKNVIPPCLVTITLIVIQRYTSSVKS